MFWNEHSRVAGLSRTENNESRWFHDVTAARHCMFGLNGGLWVAATLCVYLFTYLLSYLLLFDFHFYVLHNPSIKEMIMDTDHTVRAKQSERRVGLCNFSRRDRCL